MDVRLGVLEELKNRLCGLSRDGLLGAEELVETAAPQGYNKVTDPITVTIEATYKDDGTLNTWSVKLGDEVQQDQTVEVVNHAGTLLPGTGGIGTAAIQIARSIGMRVITTVSSEAKAEFVRELGAEAIRYDQEDFVERAKELTDGRGPEVIFDVVGAKYLEPNLKALAVDGTLIIIGLQGGRKAEIDLGSFMVKRQHLLATTLRARPAEQKAAIMAQVHEQVWPQVASGQIRAVVDREFPLEEAAQAHEHFDSGTHIGKILLTP